MIYQLSVHRDISQVQTFENVWSADLSADRHHQAGSQIRSPTAILESTRLSLLVSPCFKDRLVYLETIGCQVYAVELFELKLLQMTTLHC